MRQAVLDAYYYMQQSFLKMLPDEGVGLFVILYG